MITVIAIILTIIGSLNWLLVGIFNFNLVTFLFGTGALTVAIYAIVGIAGLWMLYYLIRTRFRVDPIRTTTTTHKTY